ncbi:MAG: hypothetical protein ACJAR9_001464 [Celeribacter sp.]|jgi:hypothetical protein
MFAKHYHPMDARHPNNRAKAKEMKTRRFSETRGAKRKAVSGGMLNTQTADDIRDMLHDVERAPVVDLAAQKTLQKRLIDPARKQGEKAFWQSQPWWLRHGPLSILNKFRAIDAGEKAAGAPAWARALSLPAALILIFGLMRLDLSGADVNAFLFSFLHWLIALANGIIDWAM